MYGNSWHGLRLEAIEPFAGQGTVVLADRVVSDRRSFFSRLKRLARLTTLPVCCLVWSHVVARTWWHNSGGAPAVRPPEPLPPLVCFPKKNDYDYVRTSCIHSVSSEAYVFLFLLKIRNYRFRIRLLRRVAFLQRLTFFCFYRKYEITVFEN